MNIPNESKYELEFKLHFIASFLASHAFVRHRNGQELDFYFGAETAAKFAAAAWDNVIKEQNKPQTP